MKFGKRKEEGGEGRARSLISWLCLFEPRLSPEKIDLPTQHSKAKANAHTHKRRPGQEGRGSDQETQCPRKRQCVRLRACVRAGVVGRERIKKQTGPFKAWDGGDDGTLNWASVKESSFPRVLLGPRGK